MIDFLTILVNHPAFIQNPYGLLHLNISQLFSYPTNFIVASFSTITMRCQLTSLLTTLLVFSLMLLSSAQSFKITAKSYDHNVLGTAVRQLVSLATSDSFTIEGPTALPTKKFTEKGVEYRVYGQTLTYVLPNYLTAF
jgi:hypothetical protein